MNKFQNYAQTLINTHGSEKALIISQSCLATCNSSPNTFMYDEAAWYLDKDGSLQLSKDQKKFAGLKEKRLKNNLNFWTQVTNIIKKETTKQI